MGTCVKANIIFFLNRRDGGTDNGQQDQDHQEKHVQQGEGRGALGKNTLWRSEMVLELSRKLKLTQ